MDRQVFCSDGCVSSIWIMTKANKSSCVASGNKWRWPNPAIIQRIAKAAFSSPTWVFAKVEQRAHILGVKTLYHLSPDCPSTDPLPHLHLTLCHTELVTGP